MCVPNICCSLSLLICTLSRLLFFVFKFISHFTMYQMVPILAVLLATLLVGHSAQNFNCFTKPVDPKNPQPQPPIGLMARIRYSETDKSDNPPADLNCAAIILNETWLLSPASCLFDYNKPNRYLVKVQIDGSYQQEGIVVQQIVRNPAFNNELGAGYDLALVNVANKMQPPCKVNIPKDGLTYLEKECKLVKWPSAAARPTEEAIEVFNNQALSHSSTTTVTQSKCKFSKQVLEANLAECAVGKVCQEEAGAVVMCPSARDPAEYYVRGISSWGDAFCDKTKMYLFTRVAHYHDWIYRVTNTQ